MKAKNHCELHLQLQADDLQDKVPATQLGKAVNEHRLSPEQQSSPNPRGRPSIALCKQANSREDKRPNKQVRPAWQRTFFSPALAPSHTFIG